MRAQSYLRKRFALLIQKWKESKIQIPKSSFLIPTLVEGEETEGAEKKDRLDHGEQGQSQVWQENQSAGPFIWEAGNDPTL